PDKGAELPGGATGQPGLVHERAVAHRDQPVGGGRDPRVVGDDDQRLPGLVQALEQAEGVQGGGGVQIFRRFGGEKEQGGGARPRAARGTRPSPRGGTLPGRAASPRPASSPARRLAARGERPASSAD